MLEGDKNTWDTIPFTCVDHYLIYHVWKNVNIIVTLDMHSRNKMFSKGIYIALLVKIQPPTSCESCDCHSNASADTC